MPHDNRRRGGPEDAMQTTTASDLAALDAALARDALAQVRAERRAATLQDSQTVAPAARYAQALASVGEALL